MSARANRLRSRDDRAGDGAPRGLVDSNGMAVNLDELVVGGITVKQEGDSKRCPEAIGLR